MIVAVNVHAGLLWNQDGTVRLATDPARLRQRFPDAAPREIVFAHAVLDKDNILNLGDPAPGLGWRIATLPPVAQLEGVLVLQAPARGRPDVCPCGAKAHNGPCYLALEHEQRERQRSA